MYFWDSSQWDAHWSSNARSQADDDSRARKAIADHWAATDRAVAVELAFTLLHDPDVQGGDIDVRVQSGVAILEGRVSGPAVKKAALGRARSVDGVRDVCDLLTVGRRRWWHR